MKLSLCNAELTCVSPELAGIYWSYPDAAEHGESRLAVAGWCPARALVQIGAVDCESRAFWRKSLTEL